MDHRTKGEVCRESTGTGNGERARPGAGKGIQVRNGERNGAGNRDGGSAEKAVRADLHVHSTCSDGSEDLRGILARAAGLGLTHLAFTDHDCTRYAGEAQRLGAETGVAVIPAVEISASDRTTGRKVHILGYDYKRPEPIEAVCAPILRRRHENCLKQIGILRDLGYCISEEAVAPYAAGGTFYKQHILKYLYDTGQSPAVFGDVYRTVFKNGGPCDFDIEYAEAAEAVRAVAEAGGYAVLAHPGQQQNFDLIPKLVRAGLSGIERNHPANTQKHRELISRLAADNGLFCTGGSDFHGIYEAKGQPLGSVLAPEDCPLPGLVLIKD